MSMALNEYKRKVLNKSEDMTDMVLGSYKKMKDKNGNEVVLTTSDNKKFEFAQYFDEAGFPINAVHLMKLNENNTRQQVTNDFSIDYANKIWYNLKDSKLSEAEMLANLERDGYYVIR